jgi:hypothetical protein
MRSSSVLIVLLFCAVPLFAQEDDGSSGGEAVADHSQHIDMPPEEVVDRAPAGQPAPVDHPDGRAAGGGNAGSRVVDPYPALTAANNAYDQAVAAWQQANANYNQALAQQKAIRDKYVDPQTNEVQPGYDYYTAVAVVRSADDKVQDAWYELDRAEKAKNDAYSRAADEFTHAMKDYYGAGGAGGQGASPSAGSPSPAPSNSPGGKADRACGHC